MRPDLAVFCREALGLSAACEVGLSPLKARGSDRSYFRLSAGPVMTAILVDYDPRREENRYFAGIAGFLAGIGVPVPRIIRHDPEACLILMEDLGDTDLASLRKGPWEAKCALYRETLTIAHRLHSFPVEDFPHETVRLMEGFGPGLYRWEQDYFMERFVGDVCGIRLPAPTKDGLEAELSALAGKLSARPSCLVHRDLQSQNVMVRACEPFLIDFQGMRKGCASYDLGSLLCDPYADLSDAARGELLRFYYMLSPMEEDWAAFQESFFEASAQRLMQALGAYGYLGLAKGLPAFLAHIPAGLSNLRRAAGRTSSLPLLSELASSCADALPVSLSSSPSP